MIIFGVVIYGIICISSESSNRDSIISAAQSIPNLKHLYIVQLINPFNSSSKINIIGIRQESITEQDRVANEIKTLLHSIKPSHLIVQLSKDRYETHMNNMDINNIENLIPNTYSLNSLLSSKHLTNSTRIGLHLINYIIMNNKIRMNPYLYALLYGNNTENECDFIENIILGDIQYINNNKIYENRHKYIAATTYKQRENYGSYPGMYDLLFSIKAVISVAQWIENNKKSIKLKDKDVYQFAIDMQQKLDFGKDILQTSAKSMAYYTYKSAEKHNNNNENILVLCNIFIMLSIPMYFGNVSNNEIRELKEISNKNKAKDNENIKDIYKKMDITGIYNIDYIYLCQFRNRIY